MTTMTDVRQDFPILRRMVNGHPLVYLDSAATALKPLTVINAMETYYREYGATVHRSVHTLASEATEAFEAARVRVQEFLGAKQPESIVFQRGTTEALNLVAYGWAMHHLKSGDEILLSLTEHHSNLVPWQQVASVTGARLVFVDLTADGRITPEAVAAKLSERTRLLAIQHASNVLGTVNPLPAIIPLAHRVGAVVVVDAAQSVPHMPVNVTTLDCDFLAFSGHKMCGPTGIGVLYGKPELLEATEPLLFGGEMIEFVEREHSTWAPVPAKFEGGTPHVAGVIGLHRALDYLSGVGLEGIHAHDTALAEEAYRRLSEIPGVTVYGPAERSAVVSFNLDRIHPHDVSQVFDAEGVAIRAGHHCAQPLMKWLGVGSTARASFYLYNNEADIDALVHAVHTTRRYFGHES